MRHWLIFVGRSRELGRLRTLFDASAPKLTCVSGLRGSGKSALVRRAAAGFPSVALTFAPEPDPGLRAAFADAVNHAGQRLYNWDDIVSRDDSWSDLFEAIIHLAAASTAPFIVILDDAGRLAQARARFVAPLETAAHHAAERGVRVHFVLVGPEAELPVFSDNAPGNPATLRLDPLPLRAAARWLPGHRPHEQVRAYGVFGGLPRVLSMLDPSVTVGTNVRRLLLADSGALTDAPFSWLEREVQTPSRYIAILRTLAMGEANWSTVHQGIADLTRSGQVAPYLNRLVELGMVEMRRSLDAGPQSRSTRYSITDPFLAFWFRFVLPWRLEEIKEGAGPYYTRVVRPGINHHMNCMLPRIGRQHMQFDARESIGSAPRENGSLWGPDYDIPMAGILNSGAAFYGTAQWSDVGTDTAALDHLDGQVRATRYGFGRERRLRIIVTGRPASASLRRGVARRHDAELIDATALLGSE